ncbi:MAG: hypothetical protein U9N02_01275 [Campylobacterota bacterium]|nr:hypothetical protein [Campylobacterota bacterium]
MNTHLVEFEEQLEEMPKKKLYFIYVGIVILLVYLSWNLFGEALNSEIESKNSSISSLEKQLQKTSVNSIKKAIKKTNIERLTLTEKLNDTKFKDQLIRTKLESMDFIFFNQMGIAQILDDVLKQSLKYSVDIDVINYENVNTLYMANIFEKEKISVSGSASYKDIMNLVQYIDSVKGLLHVSALEVYIDEETSKINFDLNISHYGAEL